MGSTFQTFKQFVAPPVATSAGARILSSMVLGLFMAVDSPLVVLLSQAAVLLTRGNARDTCGSPVRRMICWMGDAQLAGWLAGC